MFLVVIVRAVILFLHAGNDADVKNGEVPIDELELSSFRVGLIRPEQRLGLLDQPPVLSDQTRGTHFKNTIGSWDTDQGLDPVDLGLFGSLAVVELKLVGPAQPD